MASRHTFISELLILLYIIKSWCITWLDFPINNMTCSNAFCSNWDVQLQNDEWVVDTGKCWILLFLFLLNKKHYGITESTIPLTTTREYNVSRFTTLLSPTIELNSFRGNPSTVMISTRRLTSSTIKPKLNDQGKWKCKNNIILHSIRIRT